MVVIVRCFLYAGTYSCVSGSLIGWGTNGTAHALNGVSVCLLACDAKCACCE